MTEAPTPIAARSLALALAAGLAGTAVMTLSQRIEQKLTQREDSDVPARLVENTTGAAPETEEGRAELSNRLHWLYGTALGAALLPLGRMREPARTATFAAMVWGSGLTLETLADPDEPPTRWGAQALGIDLLHHLVYAGAATLAYRGLSAAFAPGIAFDAD